MRDEKERRIRRLSRWMARFAAVLLAVIVAAAIYQAVRWMTVPGALASDFPDTVHNVANIGPGQVVLAVLLGLVSVAMLLYLVNAFRIVFSRIARGPVLDAGTALWIRRAGVAVAALALWRVVQHTVTVLVLSLGNPPGERMIAVSVDGATLASVFLAGMLMVLAHVLVLAGDVARENHEFV